MSPDWLYVYTEEVKTGTNQGSAFKPGREGSHLRQKLCYPSCHRLKRSVGNEPWEGPTRKVTLSVCHSGDMVTLALWAVMASIWTSPAVTARSSRVLTGHLTLTVVACGHASLSLGAVARGAYLSAFSSFLAATLMVDGPLLPYGCHSILQCSRDALTGVLKPVACGSQPPRCLPP